MENRKVKKNKIYASKRGQNYIFMAMGFGVITLFVSFHLIQTIGIMLQNYNNLVYSVNNNFNATYSEMEIVFFGNGVKSVNLLFDILIIFLVVLVIVMVFLKIYWSERKELVVS